MKGRIKSYKYARLAAAQKLHCAFQIFACDQKFCWSVRWGLESFHDSCGEALHIGPHVLHIAAFQPEFLFVYKVNRGIVPVS